MSQVCELHSQTTVRLKHVSLYLSYWHINNILCPPLFWQLFSIIVFATITAEGYTNTLTKADSICIFNGVDSACSYGVGIGVLAFLACVVFLMLDAYFPQISNAKERKYIVVGDLVFSGEGLILL